MSALQATIVFPAISVCSSGVASRWIQCTKLRSPFHLSRSSTIRRPRTPVIRRAASVQPMYGTPCGLLLHPFLSPIGLPCERPRWGFSAGIDLKTMKITWMRRNGTIRDVAPLSVPIRMGVPLTTAFLISTQDYHSRL